MLKLKLKFDKMYGLDKCYKILNFTPETYYSHSFVVGEQNKYSASRCVCTAYLSQLEIRTYKNRVTFAGTFKYTFNASGSDCTDIYFEICKNLGKDKNADYRLDGLFTKTLYCNERALKDALTEDVQQKCSWNNVIQTHESMKYINQFGTVPSIDAVCAKTQINVAEGATYDRDLDLATSVLLRPISMSKYITYYVDKLKTQKSVNFTEDDLAAYYDYVKRYFAQHICATDKTLSDYTPSLYVPSVEYFAFQRRLVRENAVDFEKVKEFGAQLKPYLTEEIKESYIIDLYNIATTKTATKKTVKKTSKKAVKKAESTTESV